MIYSAFRNHLTGNIEKLEAENQLGKNLDLEAQKDINDESIQIETAAEYCKKH